MVHPKTYKSQEVEYLVHECVPGSAIAHRHGMEICFSLPLEQTHKFSGNSVSVLSTNDLKNPGVIVITIKGIIPMIAVGG